MHKIKCCLGCRERKEGCHGKCEKYKSEKAFYEAMKNFIDFEKKKKQQYDGYKVDKKRRLS